jgi:PAS domain S-box-containing protein
VIEQVEERNEGSAATEAIRARLAAVLDAVADGITVQAPDGNVVYANAMAVRLVGFAASEELLAATPAEILARFELFDAAGLPLPLSALPGRRALEGLTEPAITVGFRVLATGEVRWAQVGAEPLLDEAGNVVFAINTFHDITDRILIEERLRESEARYRQLVEAMPQIAWTTDRDGRVDLLNDRWFEYTGLDRASSDPVTIDAAIHPDDREPLAACWSDSLEHGHDLETQVRIRRHDSTYRWHLLRAVPIRDAEGTVGTWIGTSTDIEAAKRAEGGLRVLADAAVRLDQTLELGETLDTAAAISVPVLADWCVIDVFGPDGTLQRVAVATAETGREAVVAGLREHPTDPSGADPASQALREGRPVVVEAIGDEHLRRWARDPGHGKVLRELAPRSAMAFPLAARGQTLGTMLMLSARSGRQFEPSDVVLAEELAKRAALAISNAELYAAEQHARQDAEASAERMALLQRVTRLLADTRSGTDILNVAITEGLRAVGAAAASIALANEDGDLVVAASRGYPDDVLADFRVIPGGSPVPIAVAFRDGLPVWIEDVSSIEDPGMQAALARTGNRSICAIPLVVEGGTVGTLGLSWDVRREFTTADKELILTEAGLYAQALARVSLMEGRERLLADLESQRNRLEAVIQQMPGGVLIADAGGRLVMSNGHAGEIWRGEIPADRPLAAYDGYVAFHPDGTTYKSGEWPLERALANGEVVTGEEIPITRLDGTPGVIEVAAAPIRDRDGGIVAAVSTFSDVSTRHRNEESRRFVADATTLLASSLDYEETIRRVAELAVPGFADWCAVDLTAPDGDIERLVIAHVDPERVQLARELRERYPPNPDAPQGTYAVMRSGKAELVEDITEAMVDLIPDPELRRIMHDLQLRSYLAVPLIAGGDTLGVITFVAAESGRRYTTDDLTLAESLATQAASAIQNARLFRDVGRYKRILDATLDAVLMFDPATYRLSYVNQGAIDQLGHDRETLLSMRATDISDDLDDPTLAAIVAPLAQGRLESRTVTMTQRHANGRRVPVEVLLQHVVLPGEPGRIVAIARDISDRVEAQARLQRLAESEHARAAELNAVIRAMGEGVVVCAADGTILLANPAAEELFPEIMAGGYGGIVARLDDPERRAPRLGIRAGPVELQIRGEDERWIELSTYPVSARTGLHGGSVAETIVLFRDVTEARQRQAVRDTFIGVLSHELRTPVTTIYAGSKVLARGVSALDEEVRRSVFEDIHVEAERLHRLVEDVIALTRFGEQDGEVGNEPVLLQRLLPGVVRSEEARWPGVAFNLRLPPGVPTVGADPTYVEQVMRNLLSNAAKYGGPGSVVETAVEAGDSEVVVRILDDGPGFPAEEGERLFELFFRSPSTAGAVSGAGIGLFVCARLIRAMGGRIWAQPRPEGGSEFAFSLQVMRDDAV